MTRISSYQKLRSVGVSQEQADIQAQAMEKVINEIATRITVDKMGFRHWSCGITGYNRSVEIYDSLN